MKKLLTIFYKVFHKLYLLIKYRVLNEYQDNSASNEIFKTIRKFELPKEIMSGPFIGLKYFNTVSISSSLIPKLVGSYEQELHSLLEKIIIGSDHTYLINIGCGEGYYSVGLASKMNSLKYILAVDIHEGALYATKLLAKKNNIKKDMVFQNHLDLTELSKTLMNEKVLIISDCEGFEEYYLDPVKFPILLQANIIVEVHDFFGKEISKIISDRFKKTHRIKTIHQANRNTSFYSTLSGIKEQVLRDLLDEKRDVNNFWMHMERKTELK